MRRLALFLAVAAIVCPAWQRKKKEKPEPPTQVLELPKEPPQTVVADGSRLVFRVSPLSARGLLSQQVRDALKWLLGQDRAQIVKLRAFVAGSGDIRRVKDIVSEVFTEKRLPLPVVTVVQVGALPREGAQVVIEATAVDPKRVTNPGGLAFIGGQQAMVRQPLQPTAPLIDQSLEKLAAALSHAGSAPEDMLRVTCFTSSLDGADYLRQRLYTAYPKAVWNVVQQNRESVRTLVECEAVARARKAPERDRLFLGHSESENAAGAGPIFLVGPRRLVFTGTQLAFGSQESDALLAFQRLGKSLEQAGTSFEHVFATNTYPLSWAVVDLVRKVRPGFYGKHQDPDGPVLMPVFEGLPSLDASFGIEVAALLPEGK